MFLMKMNVAIEDNGGLLSSGGDKHKTINRLITKNYKK